MKIVTEAKCGFSSSETTRGALRHKSSQLGVFVKRDASTGRFMDGQNFNSTFKEGIGRPAKASQRIFKGVRKEK
jgi:hypothetical protein